jgi:hypothetical protein
MLAILAVLLLSPAGCGEDAEPGQPPPPRAETPHQVPDLPAGWEVHVTRGGGFALGVPPGWTVRERGTSTLIRSPDRLVAVSIVPDRTREAVEIPLGEFARRTLTALPGYEGELAPGPVRRFGHRYRGVRVEARAVSTVTGARQRVQVIVVRRGRHATFTTVIAASAPEGRAAGELAERMVKTLRSRPT